MARIEILVEEASMKEFLSIYLPNVVDSPWILNVNYFIRSFEGKSDLQKNIPTKIKTFSNWNHEAVGVVILQDQDSMDCIELKSKLISICVSNGDCKYLIRIVCRELESWYLGDFNAIKLAYPSFKHTNFVNKAKFRDPDLCYASAEMKRLLPEFQKVSSAKRIAPFIDLDQNRSESFNQTIKGIINFFNTVRD